MPFLATLRGACDRGLAQICTATAEVCLKHEDGICALDSLVRGCALGRSDPCSKLSKLVTQCDPREFCVDILQKVAEGHDRTPSSDLAKIMFDGVDHMCHSLRDGAACRGAGAVLDEIPEKSDKALEHMSLACEYGDIDGCRSTIAKLEVQCRERGDAAACCRVGQLLQNVSVESVRDPKQGQEYIREARGLGVKCAQRPKSGRAH